MLFVLYIPCSFPLPRFLSICDCSYLIFFEIPFALPAPASLGQAIPACCAGPWAVLHHQLVLERAFSEEVTAVGVSFTGCWWAGGVLVQGAIPQGQNSPQHAQLAWWWVKLTHMQYACINIQVDSCRELCIYRRKSSNDCKGQPLLHALVAALLPWWPPPGHSMVFGEPDPWRSPLERLMKTARP